ncbi:hypothetical protein Y033_4797 [Burkholderia pseudomallei MSHR435]|nr:hypothetical protein BG17_4104 [Burkholderia pseudomallei MSHR491]KGW81853.1 hypothetical protein Y034_5445 [Burkholderia pseudomallei MSHR449]KGX74990.1 hypothetical protein Y033_4797 [Burkholderia pseudomallei MSHR435]
MYCLIIECNSCCTFGRITVFDQLANVSPEILSDNKHTVLYICSLSPIAKFPLPHFMAALLKRNVDGNGKTDDRTDSLNPCRVGLLNGCP